MAVGDAQRQFGWTPAGPVAEAYGLSRAPISVIVGPTGGGKTTESIRRTIRIAQWQHPSPIDGVRKARTVVLAPSYRRIWDQVIPSYKEEITWWEKGWKGGTGEPAEHIYDFMWKDDHGREIGRVHVEVLFRAPGEAKGAALEEFFRGLQCTAFWLPELDTHETSDMLSLASNRTGRYPKPDDRPHPDMGLPDAYEGVFGDANAPLIGGWMMDRFFNQRRPADQLFQQPPGYDPAAPDGFHPLAENVANLRKYKRNYYLEKAKTHEPWDIARLLQNKPGYSRDGQPVHPDFDPVRMVAVNGLAPDPDSPLVIGMDAGSNTLRHAAVFLQRTYLGQVRGLAEVVPDGQSDIVEFSTLVRRMVDTRFKDCKQIVIAVDPAARGQSAMRKGVTWAQVIQEMTGIEVQLAPSQDPRIRRTAVDQALRRNCGPNDPGFVLSGPDMPKSIAAMAGGYRFKRNGDKVSPTPDKSNGHSEPADAIQYGSLVLNGVGALEGRFITAHGEARDDAGMAAILPD
jgi:hypothetical protein